MKISKFKIAIKLVFGGVDSVVEYILEVLNNALASIDPANQAKIAAALNIAKQVLSVLNALAWLCPTKWQIAYHRTIAAVDGICEAMGDLALTAEELAKIRKSIIDAIAAWRGDDDDTCVDCVEAA